MNDKEFSRLLEFLGLSCQGYRKVRKGVKKRVCRYMQSLGRRIMRLAHVLSQKLKGN
jgi:chemotaxis protein methyltransferase CheR